MSTCDWGYYAISGSEMHCGADTLYNIHFDGISTYAVYLNGTVDNGGVGAWWLKDSIIEASGGGGIYLKSKSGDCPTSPCGVSNIWMEAVATSSAVQVDGIAQKPRVLKLVDTAIFFAEYSYLNNIELSNSNLVTYGCRFDNADGNQDIVIDEQSTIVAHDVYLNGSSEQNVIVESVASQTGKINTINLSIRGNLTRGEYLTHQLVINCRLLRLILVVTILKEVQRLPVQLYQTVFTQQLARNSHFLVLGCMKCQPLEPI